MKISKLFHWLYAVIMLLPIFAIGVTCGYAMFNKNAYQNYSTEDTEYRYSNITSTTQLVSGNEYLCNIERYNVGTQLGSISPTIKFTDLSIDLSNYTNIQNIDRFYILNGSGWLRLQFCNANNEEYYISIKNNINNTWVSDLRSFTFTFESITANSSNPIDNAFSEIIVIQAPLNNVFYSAVNKVQQSPLFNWAENSFLVAPFAYIVSLFSMPTNSPIVMFLSYWLAISIIWLVFDLIMYIPLLVHRWLDKGVLE